MIARAASWSPKSGRPLPACTLRTTSRSSHRSHNGSYTGSQSGASAEFGATFGSRIPPKTFMFSLAQRTSASASSTSLRKICASPARRPGAAAQKSASQRLCAWRPAQRRS